METTDRSVTKTIANMKICAIIPTYNQKQDVKDAVESLLKQTVKIDRIVVVNNASTDGTESFLKKNIHDKRFMLVSNPKNLGVTGGRNKGLEYTDEAEYILFFDHDMVAEPTMLEELLKVAKKNKNIGIVTPKIYFWDKKHIIWSAGTDINLSTGQTLFRGGEDKKQYDSDQEVAVAPAVLLVRKTVIDNIGGFDSTYYAVYEDTDFCFRARKHGFQTWYAYQAIAYHKIPYDQKLAGVRLLGRAFWIGRNRVIFMKKYGNMRSFIFFLPVFLAHYLLLSLRYRRFHSFFSFVKGSFVGLINK